MVAGRADGKGGEAKSGSSSDWVGEMKMGV